MKGNGLKVDSFDSSDPAYNTNGLYDPAKPKDGGDVASKDGLINAQGVRIKGKLLAGPQAPVPDIGSGSVGELAWNGPGIEPGWYRSNFRFTIPDVVEPYNSGSPGVLAPSGADTNLYVLGSGKYIIDGDLTLYAHDTILVSGNATLYVTGNVDMKSSGANASAINILNNASLKIFVGGSSATFQAVNTVGNASTFQYFGLPSNVSLSWIGNSAYLGTIYAPQATFFFGAGENITYNFQGACVVNAVRINGHFSFHFDENLKRIGPAR